MFHKLIIFLSSLLFTLAVITASSGPAFAAAPPNENFANAVKIDVFSFNAKVDVSD